MTQDAGLIGGVDASLIRRVRRLSLLVALLLTVLFSGSVYVFGRYGGGFVDSLSGRVGEIVAARAKSLDDSGQLEAAANVFAEALKEKFDDPQQRFWTCRRYGETLMELQRWPDAAEAFRGALAINSKDWLSRRLLCEALKRHGRVEAMREAARSWQAAAGDNQEEAKRAEAYLK